jgi:hypothetical protein
MLRLIILRIRRTAVAVIAVTARVPVLAAACANRNPSNSKISLAGAIPAHFLYIVIPALCRDRHSLLK